MFNIFKQKVCIINIFSYVTNIRGKKVQNHGKCYATLIKKVVLLMLFLASLTIYILHNHIEEREDKPKDYVC